MSVFFFLNNDKNAFNLYQGKTNETHERVTRNKKKNTIQTLFIYLTIHRKFMLTHLHPLT